MEQVTRKIGQNRGKPRLWIEGKILTDAGIKPGDRYDLPMTNTGFSIIPSPDGKRKVSGKGDKPIIDISGGGLGPIIGEAQRVTVTIDRTNNPHGITCLRIKPEASQ